MRARFSLVAILLWTAAIYGQSARGTLTPHDTPESRDHVLQEIVSGDSAKIDAAVQQIRYWIDNSSVPTDLWSSWSPALMKAGRYQDVADCALLAVLNVDDLPLVENCLMFRAQALLELNKPQQALQAAKSFYNVCTINNTKRAIDLVATCLAKCYPDDGSIADRYRSEQIAAADLTIEAGSPTQSHEAPTASIVKAVPLNDALFANAVEESQDRSDLINYGNLLLIADRGAEAEKIFREQYRDAKTKLQLANATDGIARCLKAEDGNIHRAKEWLRLAKQEDKSVQPSSGDAPLKNGSQN